MFVWTVNDQSRMERLISLHVDGIITDNAPLAKTVLLEAGEGPIDELLLEPIDDMLEPIDGLFPESAAPGT